MQKGDLASAVGEYRELTRLAPGNAEAFYDLGLALKQQDDFEEAEAALRTAMRLDAALPEAPYTLGVVLWQTGRADEAAALFQEALARRREYADAHYMLGTILKQRGDLDVALAEFRETIRINPASAEAHTSLAQVLQAKHDPGAAAAFAEAERLSRRKADAQAAIFAVNAGMDRMKRHDLAGAIAQFREAVRLDAANARAHLQLALALRRSGALAESRNELQAARRLAPSPKPAAPVP